MALNIALMARNPSKLQILSNNFRPSKWFITPIEILVHKKNIINPLSIRIIIFTMNYLREGEREGERERERIFQSIKIIKVLVLRNDL